MLRATPALQLAAAADLRALCVAPAWVLRTSGHARDHLAAQVFAGASSACMSTFIALSATAHSPRVYRISSPSTRAVHSISTRAPSARPVAPKALRAGFGPGK